MARLRSEHRWAAHLIAANISGVFVRPVAEDEAVFGHDFDVERNGRVRGAVVVTAAVDERAASLWATVTSREQSWIGPELTGGWTVALLPYARAGAVRHRLPALLGLLERYGVEDFRQRDGDAGPGAPEARRIGVASALHHEAAVGGSIFLTVQHPALSGRATADEADSLPAWLSGWLREPDQADDLARLERSGVDERHLFVVVPAFTTAPGGVARLLLCDDPPLPRPAADLPSAVTCLWVASTWASGMALRWWARAGWQRFHKI